MISRLTAKLPKWSPRGSASLRSRILRTGSPRRSWSLPRLRRPASYLALKFAKTSLLGLLARGRRDSRPVAIEKDLSGRRSDAAGLKEVLRDLVAEYALDSPRVVLVLDEEEVLSRELRLPTDDPAEIEAMIPFQAEALLPMPLQEFIINHRLAGKDDQGRTRVLLEAAPCRLVEDRLAALADCGLPVAAVRSTADLAGALAGRGLLLVPPSLQQVQLARVKKRRTFLTTLLVLYCLAVVTFVTEWRYSTRQDSLFELQDYLQATAAGARQLAEMRSLTGRLDSRGARGTGSLELLAHACAAAPSGIMIFEVALVKDESMVILGEASATDQALDFVEALREKPGCAGAVLEFAGARGRTASSGTAFEIKIKH